MAKTVELVAGMTSEIAREKLGVTPKYEARALVDQEEINEGRRLAVGKFANLGKIRKEEVGDDGLLKFDPFLERSTFFGVYDQTGELNAVARLIWRDDTTVDDMRLPTDKIDDAFSQFLHEQKPGAVAEIGSLAKTQGSSRIATLKLLREIFDFAVQNGIEHLVCGLEPQLYPTYKKMFGGALRRMHEETIEFPGIEGQQVPLVINIEDALSYDFDKMQARNLGDKAVGAFIRYFFNSTIQPPSQ